MTARIDSRNTHPEGRGVEVLRDVLLQLGAHGVGRQQVVHAAATLTYTYRERYTHVFCR